MVGLEDLAVKHPYYCSTSNYYSNEANETYDSLEDFIEEYSDADIDMNLIFRWDVIQKGNGSYYLNIFMIKQRKGIFSPIQVNSITEADVNILIELLQKHKQRLDDLWKPL